jgi:hypothetical protein
MGFVRRLFSRGAPKHDRRPGVYITRSVMTGAWNAPAPARMDEMEKEAAQMGREDGQGGQHSVWTKAPKPAALRRFEARRDENIALLQAERVGAVGLARADAEVRDGEHEFAKTEAREAKEALAVSRAAAEQVSEVRHGFAAIPRWAVIILAGLLVAADVLFTQLALVESLGDLPAWEAWVIAGVIGVLLFGAGIGKAYVEAVRERAEEAGERGPFGPATAQGIIRFVYWPTVVMVVALAFARVSLVDWESETFVEWAGAMGALFAITMAAALVAVVAYLAGRILFASRPVAVANADVRAAVARRDRASKRLDVAHRVVRESEANADGLDASFEKAVVMAEEAWMGVIALYWRGFAQARPDEQPDIDAINALTNGHRPLEHQEVYG